MKQKFNTDIKKIIQKNEYLLDFNINKRKDICLYKDNIISYYEGNLNSLKQKKKDKKTEKIENDVKNSKILNEENGVNNKLNKCELNTSFLRISRYKNFPFSDKDKDFGKGENKIDKNKNSNSNSISNVKVQCTYSNYNKNDKKGIINEKLISFYNISKKNEKINNNENNSNKDSNQNIESFYSFIENNIMKKNNKKNIHKEFNENNSSSQFQLKLPIIRLNTKEINNYLLVKDFNQKIKHNLININKEIIRAVKENIKPII